MTGTQAHCHISDEIAGCLTAHMGKDDAPVVVDGTNIQTYVCELAHSSSNGLGVGESDVFPTLDTSSGPAVWARENGILPPSDSRRTCATRCASSAMGPQRGACRQTRHEAGHFRMHGRHYPIQ